MAATHDLLWLTFFGRPACVSSNGGETPLVTRYRKGLGLVAWLAAQANRPQRRHAVAKLLWPGLEDATARANLRVVINDLVTRFSTLGIPDTLEAGREWIVLRTGGRLVTDDMLMLDPAIAAIFSAALAQRVGMPWCVIDGLDEESDFGDWLKARRSWFAARHAAPVAAAGAQPAWRGATSTPPDVPVVGAEWRRLAILRVVLDEEASNDERVALARRRARTEGMADGLDIYGAVSAGSDTEGANFVFGLHARGAGFRLQALRAALAGLEMEPLARIGLASGYLLVESGGMGFLGTPLTRAARLALCAEPGEIAADESFADLVACNAHRSETRHFRALPGETSVFFLTSNELRRAIRAPATPDTPFCGRDNDMARLAHLLSRGAKVAIVGPPGIGKTRLAQEFARSRTRGGVFWLFCRIETSRVPWAALVEMLSREDLDALPVREADAVQHLIEHRHIGLTQRGALIGALTRLFAGSLVVTDDAQWMDAATASLLDELARQTTASWLITRRPQDGGWQPPDAIHYEQAPLDDEAAEKLFCSLCEAGVSRQVLRSALLRGRGVPLFLIAEANARSPHVADAVVGLCNLPVEQSKALAAAALLGQQFRRDDLAALVGTVAAGNVLAAATAQGIVLAYHCDNFGFVHPLLREACLARLDPADEKPLAARAAKRFLTRGETVRAAELFERADDEPRARKTWLAAARTALFNEDAAAACALFERLALLGYPEGTEGEWARIHHAKALILRDGYGIPEIALLCRPVALANRDAADDETREIRFAAEALIYLWSGGESATSGLIQANRLIELADTPEQHYAAIWARANTSFFTADFVQARQDFETLRASKLDVAARTRYFPSDPLALFTACHAWLLWFTGATDWRREIENHVAAMETSSSQQDQCIAHVFAAVIHLAAGERATFAAHALRALQIAEAEAFAFWEILASLLMQIVRAQEGVAPEITACDALEAAMGRAYPAGINTARWLLGEAWVAAHRWDEAQTLLERALAVADNSEHLYCLPDLHRLHAAALAGHRHNEKARHAMRKACRLARETGLVGWLARWKNCPPEHIADHWKP